MAQASPGNWPPWCRVGQSEFHLNVTFSVIKLSKCGEMAVNWNKQIHADFPWCHHRVTPVKRVWTHPSPQLLFCYVFCLNILLMLPSFICLTSAYFLSAWVKIEPKTKDWHKSPLLKWSSHISISTNGAALHYDFLLIYWHHFLLLCLVFPCCANYMKGEYFFQ